MQGRGLQAKAETTTGRSETVAYRPVAVLGAVPAMDCFWLRERPVAGWQLDGATR